jgi:hypothetical protein
MGLVEILILLLVLGWVGGIGYGGPMYGGGLIHLVIVIAVLLIIFRVLQGRQLL